LGTSAVTPTTTPPAESSVSIPPVDPQITALQAEVAKSRRDMDELKKRLTPAPPQPPLQMPPPNAQPPMDATQLKAEFFRNPLELSTAIAQRAAAEQNQVNYDTLREVARKAARDQDPEVFDRFETEINLLLANTVQPQFHTNVNVWKNAFNQVRGQHIPEILEMKKQTPPNESPRGPAVHVSHEGGPAAPNRAAPAPAQEGLNADEKAMAKRLGITEEQYLQGKKDYDNQSEKGPSSWDKYFTFSSKDRRRQERAARNAANANARK